MCIILYFYHVAHNYKNIVIRLVQQDLFGNLVAQVIMVQYVTLSSFNNFFYMMCIQNQSYRINFTNRQTLTSNKSISSCSSFSNTLSLTTRAISFHSRQTLSKKKKTNFLIACYRLLNIHLFRPQLEPIMKMNTKKQSIFLLF